MTREIKFRAWNTTDKIMCIGDYDENFDGLIAGISKGFLKYEEQFILMQYTGLKDKNGVEIYEGDIVQNRDETEVVVYEEGGYNIMLMSFLSQDKLKIEVIGNIYENPSLLDKEDQELLK